MLGGPANLAVHTRRSRSLMGTLTHFDEAGAAHMVDVGAKEVTARAATASAVVRMLPATLSLILDRKLAKGDVLETARLAGIMAAKQTAALIPLCHPIPIDGVDVRLAAEGADAIRIEATVRSTGRTGVEMEALTAAAVAGLTIYDMCKSADRGMVLERVQLEEKRGGKSGDFRRAAPV